VAAEMPKGFAVDVIEVDVLRQLLASGESHPVSALRTNPEEWGTVVSVDPQWAPFAGLDVSVDTPEDYWRMRDAFGEVGTDPRRVSAWIRDRGHAEAPP
jgi:spore coat polysaccharide biosynthesis protein SpsF (cytidylyltransferase family)